MISNLEIVTFGKKVVCVGRCVRNLRLCLFGVILGRMENEEEKMMFLIVWLRVEKRRDFGGTHQFSLLPLQNTISPNWRENESESWTKLPTFSFYYYYFFFFWQPQPGVINVACLLFFFFPFFLLGFTVSLDVDFFF